jgi:hypothetical protein
MKVVNHESVKQWAIFTGMITVLLLIVILSSVSVGCSASPGSQTTGSPQTSLTTPVSSITSKTTPVQTSGTSNSITKSGNGVPLTDQNALLGSWAEIELDNYISGLTQTRNYSTSGPDAYIFLFDRINVSETHGGSAIYTGEWTFNNGTLTMKDNSPNSRPIVYSDLRLQNGILTAIYQDSDLSQILTWQKLSN